MVAMTNSPSVKCGSAACKVTSASSVPGGPSVELAKSDGGTDEFRMSEGVMEADEALVG